MLLVLPMVAPAGQPVSRIPDTDAFDAALRTFAARARQPGVRVMKFDPAHTAFGFELRTRWGQRVQGQFPRYEGVALLLPDGRRQVRIQLAAAAVQVAGSARYTAMARGETFFDARHYPHIEFVSSLHDDVLTRDGGPLEGQLRLHGVTRAETFVVAPATCERVGEDCDALASGSVARGDYGMGGMRMVLADSVRFTMQVRLREAPP